MNTYDETGPNDFKEQIIPYGDTNNFKITREDPYGMYYVKLDKGQVPSSLSGSFTTRGLAEKTVKAYVARNKPVVRKIEKTAKE